MTFIVLTGPFNLNSTQISLFIFQFDVRVVATEKALHFFDRAAISSVQLYEDKHEWEVGAEK